MSNKNRKKILLLSPDITRPVFNQNGRLKVERFLPPLGLGYLAAVLKRKNYQVKVIDCTAKPLSALRRKIVAFGPQVAGISCFTEHRGGSLRLARLVKGINKKMVVVFGGSHATFMHQQILSSYPEVDFCILGEGEVTFVEFLERFFRQGGKDYGKVPGLAFRKGPKIIVTPPRGFIADLEELPFPEREWIDLSQYSFPHKEARGKQVSSLITTRGCPFNCQFCSTTQFWGRRTRFRSVEKVMAEIDFLYQGGSRILNFLDDTFTLDQKRTQEICRKIIERKYNLLWCCGTRAGMVSKKTAKLMKKSGCFLVVMGVESLSPKILRNINKKIKISQVKEAVKNLKEAGIKNSCLLMIGNPGEDWETIGETIDNLKKVNPDATFTNLTQVYPGTPLYQLAKEKGLMSDDYWLDEKKASPIYLVENSLEDLLRFEKTVWENFFWQKKDFLRWFSRKTGLGDRVWPIMNAIRGIERG